MNNSLGSPENLTAYLLQHYNSTNSADAQVENFQLYSMLHSAGRTPILIVPAIALSLIGLVGILLNAAIVYITIKYRKSLNRNANYLLALNAFFDMLQLTHPFPFLIVALSGTNFIGTFQSIHLLLPALFGIQCSLTCIACLGIDRLLSVLMPMQYHKMQMSVRQRHFYCALHTLLCISNGIWNAVGLWQKSALDFDKPVTGFIGQIGWDSSKDIGHYLVGPLLIWTSIFCYVAIGILLFAQKCNSIRNGTSVAGGGGGGGGGTTAFSDNHQKLLKSLGLIVSVHCGSLLFGSVLLGFSFLYSTLLNWYMMTLSLCIILIGACSSAIVLYLNSFEYRSLFKMAILDVKKAALRTIGVTSSNVVRLFTVVNVNATNKQNPHPPVGPLMMAIPKGINNRTTPY